MRAHPTRRALCAAAAAVAVVIAVAGCGGQDATDTAPDVSASNSRGTAFLGFDTAGGGVVELSRLGSLVRQPPTAVSLFVKLDSTFTAATLSPYTAIGVTPFLTLEPWCSACNDLGPDQPDYRLQRLVDGVWDAQLGRIARAISGAGKPVYLRFAHEMNAFWYPWAAGDNGNSARLYVEAWKHVHALIAAQTGTLVRWVWSPNIPVPGRPGTAVTADTYPGDTQVDLVGLTCYGRDGGTVDGTCGPGLAALEKITRKPVVLSEIGASGPGQASWIGSLPAFLEAHPEIRGLIYFNTTVASSGATADYKFDLDAASVASMRRVASSLG